jgi:hypothetical protein
MTVVEQNIHEIPLFIRRRAEFGFEYLNFGFEHSVPRLLAKDPKMKERLASEVRTAVEEDAKLAPIPKPHGYPRIDLSRLRLLDLA